MRILTGPHKYRQVLDRLGKLKEQRGAEAEAETKAEKKQLFLDAVELECYAFETLLTDQDLAAFKLLKILNKEIVLFHKPGVKIVIHKDGIKVQGSKNHLRTYEVDFEESDSVFVLAIKAALHDCGGCFRGKTPATFVQAITVKIDALAEELWNKIDDDTIEDLLEEESTFSQSKECGQPTLLPCEK